MITTSVGKRITLVGMFAVLALSVSAAKPPSTEPGRYTAWGPDIDEVEIVRSFHAVAYANLFVEPLDVSSTPAAEDADVAEKVSSVLGDATKPFVEGVKRKIGALMVLDELPADLTNTLIVRTRVTMMEPGSRSKRMFIGYGAGAARAAITGEIVDAKSGAVLVRFTQERRSGIERFGRGSSYEEIMKRNLMSLGQDVANLLKEF